MKKRDNWITWFILISGLLVTIIVTIIIIIQIDQTAKTEFKFECNEIASKIDRRIQAHAQLLRSGAAFFASSDSVSREDWKIFIEQSKINQNLSGIQGTAFNLRITKDNLREHISKIRAEGFTDYKVWPEDEREIYTSIIFIEPFSGRNLRAFGYDMMTDSVRREAMERARDLDIVALSGKLRLVQETETVAQAGNIMFVPVYQKGAAVNTVEQRRVALKGWVSSPYRMNDLMSGIMTSWEFEDNFKKNSLHIYDGQKCSPESLLFKFHKVDEQKESENIRFSLEIPVDFNGHLWTLVFTQKKGNIFIDYLSSWTALLEGLIISILLFLLIRSLIGTKYNAQKIAKTLTSELKESERLLKKSQEIAMLGTCSLDLSTGVWKSSEILDAIFGIDEKYIRSMEGLSALIHPDYRKQMVDYLQNIVIAKKQPFNREYKIIRNSDKEERWILGLDEIEFDSNNNPVKLIGTINDITERKKAELELRKTKEFLEETNTIAKIGSWDINLITNDLEWTLEHYKIFEIKPFLPSHELFSAYRSKIHPDDIENLDKVLDEALKYGTDIIFEHRVLLPNNNIKYVIGIGKVYKDNAGNIIGAKGTNQDITERKKAEEELQYSNFRFEMISRATNDALWEWNFETGKLWANETHQRLYGLTLADPVPTEEFWKERIHPEDRDAIVALQNKTLDTDKNVFFSEYRFSDSNNEYRNICDRNYIMRNKEGNPIGMVGSMLDITELKKAEQLLTEREQHLYTILQSALECIKLLNEKGELLEMNPAGLAMIEADNAEQVLGHKLIELVDPKYKHAFGRLTKDVFDGKSGKLEFEIIGLKGTHRWLETHAVPLKNAEGKIISLLGVIRDITERKEAEALLKKAKEHAEESEERYNSFVNQITEGISRLEFSKPMPISLSTEKQIDFIYKHAIIAECNPAFMEMYGIENLNEIIGKTLTDLHGGNDNKHNRHSLRDFIQAGYRIENAVTEEIDMEGNNIFFSNNAIGIIENDKLIRMWGTQKDITEERMNQKELIKAKEKAEESDRLKSAFLANMSHEIRTPMNGILGFADLLKTPNLSGEKQQQYIRVIEKSGTRMLNIINDIVSISKIESGLMEVNIQETNINQQIDFIFTFFKPQVEAKGMRFLIKNTLAGKEAFIKSDSEKIYGILTNLVKNAIEYTEEGTIELGYALKTGNESAELEFYVKDTGIGIPKDRQIAIFERFIQADIADKMAYQGAGLGLSISKAYVEMLGGKIWVESEEGKGSIFYFTLPYRTEPEEKIVAKNEDWSGKSDGKVNPEVSGLKILIAEDDEISGMLISAIVKEHSMVVLEARTGIEAVDICRNNPDIDLILMDIQMPELDGYEATRQIRQFNKDVIIIAQTAFGLSGDKEKAIEAGCNDYISKPINKAGLLALIQKYFKK